MVQKWYVLDARRQARLQSGQYPCYLKPEVVDTNQDIISCERFRPKSSTCPGKRSRNGNNNGDQWVISIHSGDYITTNTSD